MNTKTRTIRLTDEEVATIEALAAALNISGQRGATFQPFIQHLAEAAAGALPEMAWLLDIGFQVAGGADLEELLETTQLPE